MKTKLNFLLILIVAILMSGMTSCESACHSAGPETNVVQIERSAMVRAKIQSPSGDTSIMNYNVTRIHFDGHRYIEFMRSYKNNHQMVDKAPTVLHDPDCPCGLDDTDTEDYQHTTTALDLTSYQRRLNEIQNLLAPTYVNLNRLPDANATGH